MDKFDIALPNNITNAPNLSIRTCPNRLIYAETCQYKKLQEQPVQINSNILTNLKLINKKN